MIHLFLPAETAVLAGRRICLDKMNNSKYAEGSTELGKNCLVCIICSNAVKGFCCGAPFPFGASGGDEVDFPRPGAGAAKRSLLLSSANRWLTFAPAKQPAAGADSFARASRDFQIHLREETH